MEVYLAASALACSSRTACALAMASFALVLVSSVSRSPAASWGHQRGSELAG